MAQCSVDASESIGRPSVDSFRVDSRLKDDQVIRRYGRAELVV
jgi:hypothetical protein